MVDDIVHLELVDEGEIELDRAALEISALDHPGVDLSSCLDQLDRLTALIRSQARGARTPAQAAACLAQVLAADSGFEGDRETYDDPANTDLIRVLERRRGLPVALAILYVALARRVGWAAHALNTPGHVLVALGQPPSVVIDPFNGGEVVGAQTFSRLRRAGGDKDVVAPMPNRAVLVRLIMNQAARAEGAGQLDRALTVFHRITTVAPAYSWGWWERARLERMTGDSAAARRSLSAMLETTRDADLRAKIVSALDGLAQ